MCPHVVTFPQPADLSRDTTHQTTTRAVKHFYFLKPYIIAIQTRTSSLPAPRPSRYNNETCIQDIDDRPHSLGSRFASFLSSAAHCESGHTSRMASQMWL